jgi:hypothetical protein
MDHRPSILHKIRTESDLTFKVSKKARICTDCKLSDSNCSERCKRYKEELAKLREEARNGG